MRELEISIDHLRRLYQTDVVQVKADNEKLKELLQNHGIQFSHLISSPSMQSYTSPSMSLGASPTFTSQTGTSNYNSMSPPDHTSSTMSTLVLQPNTSLAAQNSSKNLQPPSNNMHGLDYDEMGLGFVAEYERTPYLSPPPNQ